MKVHVESSNPALRRRVVTKLRQAGIATANEPFQVSVVVTAADTVDRAVRSCPSPYRTGDYRLLVLADTFDAADVLCALRAGARSMLPTASDSTQLAAAVHATSLGEGRMPAEVLLKLLNSAVEVPASTPRPVPLTPRQTAVLTLVADGHPNVAIAAALSCSEHTVKNVIYDMMARLQARNRAHAVARAVRAGLI